MTNLVHSKLGITGNQQFDPNIPFQDSNNSFARNVRMRGANFPDLTTAVDCRGDSQMAGFGLSNLGQSVAQQIGGLLGAPVINNGISSVGTVGMLAFIWGDITPIVNNDSRLTVFLNTVNDMRQGNTVLRVEAYRGVVGCLMALMCSKMSAWRQFYNGDAATYWGAPAGSMVRSGFTNISAYGTVGKWRGVYSTTQNDTITFTVTGDAIYYIHQRFKGASTGGVHSVTIDGVVCESNVSSDGTGLAVYASTEDETFAAANGYPTLRRIGCSPGTHTVVFTVTSATGANNRVQIEGCAGNTDMFGPSLVVTDVMKLNAAGYAASPAAYGSLALGLQAGNEYSRVSRGIAQMLNADGLNISFTQTDRYDPTRIPTQIQADNLHPSAVGAYVIAQDCILGCSFDWTRQKTYPSQLPYQIPIGASPFTFKYTGPGVVDVFLEGGTHTNVQFVRENSAAIVVGTASPVNCRLNSGDSIVITHAGAGTMSVVSR